jgi:REP element-mobilizing transposase RayT
MPKRPAYVTGHFYNRGAHRVSIFREPDNYRFVTRKIERYSRQYKLKVIAYCLLPNHYHFLVRQDGEFRAGMLPQYVFNSYSKAYNRRYNHSGTLFEGNYKVKPVEDESYLHTLCYYIHANPVLHRITRKLLDWPYSNYPEWMGIRNGTLVDPEFIEIYFQTPALYRAQLNDYLQRTSESIREG